MEPIRWVNYIALTLLGLLLPFIAYQSNKIYQENLDIQQHSPLTKLVVVDRIKGLGTMRSPNKIRLRYRGKKYSLDVSNPYFKATANLDSISVHYDAVLDRAVADDGKPKRHTALLLMIAIGGLVLVVGHLVELRRQLLKT